MRTIVTDGVAWSVCLSATIMSPAKVAELIEMPFGLWTRVSSRNYMMEVQIPHANGQF